MPWMKNGDNAATYPPLLAVDELDEAEDWSVNEVGGFLWRLSTYSAGHMTDYAIGFGDVKLFGGGRHEHLVDLCTRAGLMTLVSGTGRSRRWALVDDPEFIHLRLRKEVEWERQRDRDRKNPDLTMPVRLRDGDACRVCGNPVDFAARKGDRSGTLDHKFPGQAATVETYFVTCRKCNSSRQDGAPPELLPVPKVPFYRPKTRQLLEDHFGLEKVREQLGEPPAGNASPGPVQGNQRPVEQAPSPDPAPPTAASDLGSSPADTARPQGAVRPAGPDRSSPGPGVTSAESNSPDVTPTRGRASPRSGQDLSERQERGVETGSGRVGSGRVGPGLVGPGLIGSGGEPAPPRRSRRRGRKRRPPSPEAEP